MIQIYTEVDKTGYNALSCANCFSMSSSDIPDRDAPPIAPL